MQLLDLEETIYQLASGNSVCWNGDVLRKDKDSILSIALDSRIIWTCKRGRSKRS